MVVLNRDLDLLAEKMDIVFVKLHDEILKLKSDLEEHKREDYAHQHRI